MKKINGIFYIMFSAASFGIMPILAKIAYNDGANAVTVLVFRFFLAAVILFPYILIKKLNLKLSKKQFVHIFIYGAINNSATCLTLFLSYNYMSVGMATTMHFIYPVVVTVLAVLIYKEKLYKGKVIALLCSVIGIYCLVGGSHANIDIKGVILAVSSGIFYGLYIIGVGHSEIKNMDTFLATFYISVFVSSILFIYGQVTNEFVLNIKLCSFLCMLGIAFISTVVALVTFLKGVQIIGSSNAAVLSTLEPIVSMILGIIVLKESMTITIVIGSIMILISVIVITLCEKKRIEKV
ncbi:DMT family transporter [Haloimpatiens sp. FM7330]|uniref:DMT family transporter n=1 Tax=Haloimpatiens sp. FM7330 TaxID=3298610 RepID=UPI00363882BD